MQLKRDLFAIAKFLFTDGVSAVFVTLTRNVTVRLNVYIILFYFFSKKCFVTVSIRPTTIKEQQNNFVRLPSSENLYDSAH